MTPPEPEPEPIESVSMQTSDLLTLIITTSPTPSAPSTELLSAVLASFQLHCPDLLSCHVIVVLDTFERIAANDRLKKGQITAKGAANFLLYKDRVKALFLDTYGYSANGAGANQGVSEAKHGAVDFVLSRAEAEFGLTERGASSNPVPLHIAKTPDDRVTFIEPTERIGFGLAVRSALRVVQTPYVWVHQHDWTLQADIPVRGILEVMRTHPGPAEDPSATFRGGLVDGAWLGKDSAPVKYVCLPSVRMLSYADTPLATAFPALNSLTAKLKGDYAATRCPPTSSQSSLPSDGAGPASLVPDTIPLTPLFFWHDKPHIVSTAHYLARVFPSRLAIGRGEFIEDKIGQRARNQMKEGRWAKWACWLYYPDNGKTMCLRHLQGRHWRGAEGAIKLKEWWMEKNAKMIDGQRELAGSDSGSSEKEGSGEELDKKVLERLELTETLVSNELST